MKIFRLDIRSFSFLITVGWIGFLGYMAWMPGVPYVPLLPRRAVQPLGHFGAFAVLTSLIYLVVSPRPSSPSQRLRVLATVLLISLALALLDEGLQFFRPIRALQLSDLMFDVAGVTIGLAAISLFDLLTVSRRILLVAVVSTVIFVVGAVGTSMAIWNPVHPRVGDHWHARYQIVICGEVLAPLAGTSGGVHTHGGGIIHVHPFQNREAFANANLSLFFATSGGELTDRSLTLPSGEKYTSGDRCPSGQQGQLQVTANGVSLKGPSSYVFRNRDEIIIRFGMVGDSE